MKHPVTVTEQPVAATDPQPLMPKAFAELAHLTQHAAEQQQHRHHQHPSTQQQHQHHQQPPSTQQSSSTPATTANMPATTKSLSTEEKILLINHGLEGPTTSAQTLRDKIVHPTIVEVNAIQEMLADFCTKVLWHRYCITPASDATPEFKALTSTSVNDYGVRSPTHPVPGSSLERLMRELNRLFEDCRPDRRLLILRSIARPGYQGQDVHTLLGEEVMWLRGPGGKMSKEASLGEIGLLLECVGIKDKGSIWKG